MTQADGRVYLERARRKLFDLCSKSTPR